MAGPFIPIMWISTSTSPHTILLDWQVAVTLERDPGLRGGSVICGQAVSQPLVSSVTPLRDRVGPTVHILNSYWTKMWKPAPCGSILRSSSAPLPSRLVRSIFFLLSLYLLCGHGLLSALLPWLHVSALAPAGPGFVLLLLEGAGSRPGPVWIGVVLALLWNHQLGSWALVWVQGSRATTALFELFFALFILCSPTKIYYPWDISGWHK